MFELHVVVAAVVMLNILELIMEIVPNYPTSAADKIMVGAREKNTTAIYVMSTR
jgi:hypothetical protein